MSTVAAPVLVAPQPSPPRDGVHRLGAYDAPGGTQAREILAVSLPDAAVLVLDCLAGTLVDARLIARLAPDEPPQNARIVCDMYLADDTRGRCRRLTAEDWSATVEPEDRPLPQATVTHAVQLLDATGALYSLRILGEDDRRSSLRWTQCEGVTEDAPFSAVAVRDVVAALERYEPACSVTVVALNAVAENDIVSTRHLRGELQRVRCSPIVLNRGLREAVQRKVASGESTMSEIATRCGRTKRDRRGNRSGETSWLARRIGVMPEGGEIRPSPWVHSDTLALIARDGLGLSPREVEL